MERIVTLTERKTAGAARRAAAVEAILPALADYAHAHGGRFLLFGSAARGTMKYDSDVDMLIDFPENALTDAWDFAETLCCDLGLEPERLCLSSCSRPRSRVFVRRSIPNP